MKILASLVLLAVTAPLTPAPQPALQAQLDHLVVAIGLLALSLLSVVASVIHGLYF